MKAELAARKLADELGVELVIIRPPVLLGPGDHRFRSTSNIIRYLRGALPFLIHGGMHFVDISSRYAAKDLAFFNRNGQTKINDTVAWLVNNNEKLKFLKSS